MIYLIAIIAFVVFVYANGIYVEATMPSLAGELREKQPQSSDDEVRDYQERFWATAYHLPIFGLMAAYVFALSLEEHGFVYLLAFASLATIASLLAGLKILPPKEITP